MAYVACDRPTRLLPSSAVMAANASAIYIDVDAVGEAPVGEVGLPGLVGLLGLEADVGRAGLLAGFGHDEVGAA